MKRAWVITGRGGWTRVIHDVTYCNFADAGSTIRRTPVEADDRIKLLATYIDLRVFVYPSLPLVSRGLISEYWNVPYWLFNTLNAILTKKHYFTLYPRILAVTLLFLQNKDYHWIPRVLPRLMIGLTLYQSKDSCISHKESMEMPLTARNVLMRVNGAKLFTCSKRLLVRKAARKRGYLGFSG